MVNTFKWIFCFLSIVSPALYAGENPKKFTETPKELTIYSQGLPQADNTLLVAEIYAPTDPLSYYLTPEKDLYVYALDIILKFSDKQPGLALLQNFFQQSPWVYVEQSLEKYAVPSHYQTQFTVYCNDDKTQYIEFVQSDEKSDCEGCDFTAPYNLTWHDAKTKKTTPIYLPQTLTPQFAGPEQYAYCRGDILYYEGATRAPQDSTQYWCPAILAYHLSNGKTESFVATAPTQCSFSVGGPMGVPGTDYILYQVSEYNNKRTRLFMKKAL